MRDLGLGGPADTPPPPFRGFPGQAGSRGVRLHWQASQHRLYLPRVETDRTEYRRDRTLAMARRQATLCNGSEHLEHDTDHDLQREFGAYGVAVGQALHVPLDVFQQTPTRDITDSRRSCGHPRRHPSPTGIGERPIDEAATAQRNAERWVIN